MTKTAAETVSKPNGANATTRTRPRGFAVLALAVSIGAGPLMAQSNRPASVSSSDLARENMSHVSASSAELKAVLAQDAGLMVELKKWVAKDATDHGQVVSDSDLTDNAIFDRLETDSKFRSLATEIVQRYGYLQPEINPESALGKQQALLIQERSKWIAQSEQEELAASRQRDLQKMQKANACDPRAGTDCEENPASGPAQPAGTGNGGTPAIAPGAPLPLNPANPPNELAPPAMRGGQLLQASSDGQNNFPIGINVNGLGQDEGKSSDELSSEAGSGLASSSGGENDENGMKQKMASDPLAQLNAEFAMSNRPEGLGGAANGLGLEEMASEQAALGAGGGSAGQSNLNPSYGLTPVAPVGSASLRARQNAMLQPAELVRKNTPYEDIPSLYDMYLQAVPRPATPRRFGSEVFQNGTRDPQMIPMDLPVGPDYVVGPGDGLAIDVWGGVSQRIFRTVDRAGQVSIPEVGPVLVSGKSLADLQQELQRLLRTEFRDVSAEVSLARLRTIRVYEVGDVANPGAYDISSLSTPLNALFAAGGPTPKGSLRIVKHYRGNQLVQTVDLYDLLLHGVKGDILRLDNGDTVMVPPVGPQITVEGMVRRPSIYELKDEKDLASVLELAGGLLPSAALRHIEVQRLVAHEKETMLSLDIPDGTAPAEVTNKLESFEIQDGDLIRVFPISAYNQDAIYLDGHVTRPGRYSYQENMRVTDVIGSYKDLLPEPDSHYAEIIRLNAPDFHPTVESFDLADALANPADAPVLHAMDTVRIFSRFDFEDPPSVSVWGDVRKPGTYRTSGQIRLSDAVHMAGGFSPDAQKEDAQVFRYLPDGKFKIFSVNLNQALAGDPTEDIVLQSRDRLLIHRNAEAADPATVYVQGDVARPGRYPLTTNMTLGDLIRIGGGLKPSADTETADLTHFAYADNGQLTGQHESVSIHAALTGNADTAAVIHNGDVLTIREKPGWTDLGASITVKGEVGNPGTYGIRPGERLSSVIERAGGFQPSAYPYAAIFRRVQVRDLESKDQNEMLIRLKSEQSDLQMLPEADPDKKRAKDLALEQWQTAVEELSANPPSGRLAIHISTSVNRWKGTAEDLEVRAGDSIEIPKRPGYVTVTGQVYNPTAVSWRPGKSARWYLSQSGGPTQLANRKAIFVIRADGSVEGTKAGLWSGDSLGGELKPGDSVVVPERSVGGGPQWQTIFLAAQVASSVASAAFIAAHY